MWLEAAVFIAEENREPPKQLLLGPWNYVNVDSPSPKLLKRSMSVLEPFLAILNPDEPPIAFAQFRTNMGDTLIRNSDLIVYVGKLITTSSSDDNPMQKVRHIRTSVGNFDTQFVCNRRTFHFHCPRLRAQLYVEELKLAPVF